MSGYDGLEIYIYSQCILCVLYIYVPIYYCTVLVKLSSGGGSPILIFWSRLNVASNVHLTALKYSYFVLPSMCEATILCVLYIPYCVKRCIRNHFISFLYLYYSDICSCEVLHYLVALASQVPQVSAPTPEVSMVCMQLVNRKRSAPPEFCYLFLT